MICFSGFIDSEMIKNTMPAPSEDTLILLCGPPKMISEAVRPNLEELITLKNLYLLFNKLID